MDKITSIYTHFHFSLANVATYWVFAAEEPAFCLTCAYVCGMCGQWADTPCLRVVLTPHGEDE